MHTWVFLDGWSDIQLEVLSLSLSLVSSSGLWSVQPKYCKYCLLIAKWCLKIQIILVYWYIISTSDRTVQRTERCFGTTSAMAVQLIVHKNRTLLATILCWSPLTEHLFQDHDLLPSANYSIVAIVPKRWSIAYKAANECVIIVPMNI